MRPSNLFLAIAFLVGSACAVQAKAEHIHTVDNSVMQQQHVGDIEVVYPMSQGQVLMAAGCCDQGYEIKSAVEAGCCDQGYQVNNMTGTSKTLMAVAFSAFLALLVQRYRRGTHNFQFRK